MMLLQPRRATMILVSACLVVCLARAWAGQEPVQASDKPRGTAIPKAQTRPHGAAVAVDPAAIHIDDGDSIFIRWDENDQETVRILGIDTPETRHEEHGIPFDQPFGPEARAFAQGAFAAATEVKLVRAGMLDPYARTLGYLVINGKNYSVLAIRAGLSDETLSHYGDNGLPELAAEVTAAAKSRGPLPFEPPHVFRKRMRTLSDALKGAQPDSVR